MADLQSDSSENTLSTVYIYLSGIKHFFFLFQWDLKGVSSIPNVFGKVSCSLKHNFDIKKHKTVKTLILWNCFLFEHSMYSCHGKAKF